MAKKAKRSRKKIRRARKLEIGDGRDELVPLVDDAIERRLQQHLTLVRLMVREELARFWAHFLGATRKRKTRAR